MSMRILVAEDDPHTRAALVELLRRVGALQALSVLPDLACLDVMMPGLSGFDLCRHFRIVCPRMPILFITAKAEEIDKVVGLELGADDYIVKPFGTKEVIARIRAVARRCLPREEVPDAGPTFSDEDFQMDDLQVMPRAMRAKRGETVIELTAREMRILQLLSQNQGQVVTREDLFRTAWNEHHIPNSRTLDQTISQLRKRIETDPKQPRIIQTVYGVGYRYE